MRELWNQIAECRTEQALREVMVSIARDGSSPMFAEDVEVNVVKGVVHDDGTITSFYN